MSKLSLPSVTLFAVTTRDHHDTLCALLHCQQLLDVAGAVYFSDLAPNLGAYPIQNLTYVKCPRFALYQDLCVWYMTEFPKYKRFFTTDYILSIHWDGYPVRPEAWLDEFMDYDFIGSPLPTGEVGNNGFCLYTPKLIDAIARLKVPATYDACHPCDQVLFRRYSKKLQGMGVKIAPYELAFKFSVNTQFYRPTEPCAEVVGYRYSGSFGFHGLPCLPCMKGFDVKVMPHQQWHLTQKENFRLMKPPNLYTDQTSTRWLVPDYACYE